MNNTTSITKGQQLSITYQAYTQSEEDSWSGTIHFEAEKDYDNLDQWFRQDLQEFKSAMLEHHENNGGDKNKKIECFWYFMADSETMKSKMNDKEYIQETIGDCAQHCTTEEELKTLFETKLVTSNAICFGEYRIHPKRMSDWGRETLDRLTETDKGIYSVMNAKVDITTGGYSVNRLTKRVS